MRGFTPLECVKREPLRQKVLRKLQRFGNEKGRERIAKVLLLTGDADSLATLDRLDTPVRDFDLLMEIHGVSVAVGANRCYTVTDSSGTFSFRDDHYGSGVEYVFGDLLSSSQAKRPLDLPLDMEPHSIGKDLKNAGCEVTAAGARSYLAGLHVLGTYPNTLPYRLLGGDFSNMRALEPRDNRKDAHQVNVELRAAVLSPRKNMTQVLRAVEAAEDLQSFRAASRVGLRIIRQSDLYGPVCGLSGRITAGRLFDPGSEDPIGDAYLMGKVRKKSNLVIFSCLCRRAPVIERMV